MGRRRSNVLLCAGAGPSVGFGPVRRAQAVAAELRRRGLEATVVLQGEGPQAEWLRAGGEAPRLVAADRGAAEGVAREADRCGAPIVMLDVAHPLGRGEVLRHKQAGRSVVMIENHGPGRLAADLVVSTAERPAVSWRGATGLHVSSPAYAILGELFRPVAKRTEGPPRVLVSMGANDLDGMTLMAVAALEGIEDSVQPVLVVGPGYHQRAELQDALARTTHRWEVHYAAPEIAPLVATADLAVVSFGLAAYELAAAGVPAVLVPPRDSERWHAERFAAAGAAVVSERDPEAITEHLRPLVIGAQLRRRYSLAAEHLVDGRGTERVADLVADLAGGGRQAGPSPGH
jgi:spore coat polysaccharide biosynthesis protein SpsF